MKNKRFIIAAMAVLTSTTTALYAAKIHLPVADESRKEQQAESNCDEKPSCNIDIAGQVYIHDAQGQVHVVPIDGAKANTKIQVDPRSGVACVTTESYVDDPHSTQTAFLQHAIDEEVRAALDKMQRQLSVMSPMINVNDQVIVLPFSTSGTTCLNTSDTFGFDMDAFQNNMNRMQGEIEKSLRSLHQGHRFHQFQTPSDIDDLFAEIEQEMQQHFQSFQFNAPGQRFFSSPPQLHGNIQSPGFSIQGNIGGMQSGVGMTTEDKGDHYEICIHTGEEPDELNINLNGNMLTVTGKTQILKETESPRGKIVNSSEQTFNNSITLPRDIDPDNITRKFENGILTICIFKQNIKQGTSRTQSVRKGGVI